MQVDNNTETKTAAQGELLYNRLRKRHRHLKKWARRTGTDTFRLYDRDIPEIPLVLDLYDDAVSGALYKRPYEKDEAEEEKWLLAMRASIAMAVGIDEANVFLKERRRMKNRQEGAQYEKISKQNFLRDVHEKDLVFRVNLSDYLDTGLFLDARKKRALVRAMSAGKHVLNLFAYTCSLSVCAEKGGAAQVDSVDLSNTYLEWGKINFALNGIEEPSLIRSDVFQFITQAEKKRLKWDLVILDPPSFSNSKKMTNVFDLRRDHEELITKCLSLLKPDGKLIFSSNAKGFNLESSGFKNYVLKNMGPELTDEDFLGKRIPLCYTFEKR